MIKFLLGFSTIVLLSCGRNESDESVVYIDNVKVFEDFSMKKDFDKVLETDMLSEKASLDSIENRINYFESLKMSEESVKARNEYSFIQNQYSVKFQKLANDYTNQVNERLNQYLKEFGDSMNYDFILGTNGSGNVMYAKDTLDVTSQVIDFINNAYKK